MLGAVDLKGNLDADIAVLELDEAHAVHFVNAIPPRYCLLLNVMRDQLDRFGEIDTTLKLLAHIANHTTDTVVLNREDPRVASIASTLTNQNVIYFGLSDTTRALFPNDDDLHSAPRVAATLPDASVTLDNLKQHTASFTLIDKSFTTDLKLQGVYNIYNSAAALALVREIVGDKLDTDTLITSLAAVEPAFGRGETLTIGGYPLELVLVKNPGGFRLGLSSFDAKEYATMIAINDNYADGRDMSWLWDVNFESLAENGVQAVTGIRAYDMALRLQYEEVAIGHIDTNLVAALRAFIASHSNQPKRIYCTYTAMLALRRELSRMTSVETIS